MNAVSENDTGNSGTKEDRSRRRVPLLARKQCLDRGIRATLGVQPVSRRVQACPDLAARPERSQLYACDVCWARQDGSVRRDGCAF